MPTKSLACAALALALAAVPSPTPLEASDGALLLRCRSPDGAIGYTDRSCAVFGAQAVAIDAELVARIERDRLQEARRQAEAAGADATFDMDSAVFAGGTGLATLGDERTAAASAAPGRRSPASGCARSPAQLARDLHASVAMGDVNRIAESYHFAGMSTAAGERVLDRLQRYAGRAVLRSRYYELGFGAALADAAGVPGSLQLVLAGDGGAVSAVDFDVERYAGCWFVRFA